MNIIEEQNKKAITNYADTCSSPTPPISEYTKKVYSKPKLVILHPSSTYGVKFPSNTEGGSPQFTGVRSGVGPS
jgi:hypothetical protein